MKDKVIDVATCLMTGAGMTQTQNKVLFYLSLVSTVLGLAITFTKHVILPLIDKIKNKTLTPEDAVETVEKTKDFIDDLADDGVINGSNKKER